MRLSQRLVKLLLLPIVHGVYRLKINGLVNVPKTGPVLLVANHVSFVDAILIAGACPRPPRFLMLRRYYELPGVHWFFKNMGCIPIAGGDKPKAVLASLQAAHAALAQGEVVCIFAEGEITRHGQLLSFKKGLERIVSGITAPIVPVHLDRLWGSIFSFYHEKVLFKWPRKLPYPVTVSFGKPLAPTTPSHELRLAVQELGAEAFNDRLREWPPLSHAFLRSAKKRWRRPAVADSLGRDITFGRTLVEAYLLGKKAALASRGKRVAVLLPPCAAAATANIGVSLHGKVPVNLNYTMTAQTAYACAARAQADVTITSRAFLKKLGWEAPPGALYVEDVQASISKGRAAAAYLLLRLPPAWVLERFLLPAQDTRELATILFTSGATGTPKGVMLSHQNILSNVEALAQLFQLGERDRVLGVLPFFHAFGLTGTFWFPLTIGVGAVYHFHPLDAQRIGELAQKHKASVLLATPTFLQTYLRRVEPKQFTSLRYVIVGAEKLRKDVPRIFEDTFGLYPLEGYGCTELSPVAAVNIPDVDWPGITQRGMKPGSVGHPLPGVVMRVVHLETGATLAPGQEGLLLVKGPNVMMGYLDDPERTRQAFRDGYYVTGDIASMDADGFVTLTDRLSRFSKIGGEMVPHIHVESKLHELAGVSDQTFAVVGLPDPKRGERLVVLHKNYKDIDWLLGKLGELGLPALWTPDRRHFYGVEDFPLLGSGKLDLQALKAQAARLEAGALEVDNG